MILEKYNSSFFSSFIFSHEWVYFSVSLHTTTLQHLQKSQHSNLTEIFSKVFGFNQIVFYYYSLIIYHLNVWYFLLYANISSHSKVLYFIYYFLFTLLILWKAISHSFAFKDSCSVVTTPWCTHIVIVFTIYWEETEMAWHSSVPSPHLHGLNRAQESSNFGRSQASFGFSAPRRFQINT